MYDNNQTNQNQTSGSFNGQFNSQVNSQPSNSMGQGQIPPTNGGYSSYQMNMSHIPSDPQKPKKKKGGFFKKAMICIALGLILGLFAGTGFYVVNLVTGAANNIAASQKEKSIEAGKEVGKTDDKKEEKQTEEASAEEEDDKKEKEITTTENATAGISQPAVVLDASGVAEAVMPSVVSITNMYTQTYEFWGQSAESQGEASGSGIIVGESDTELLIVTNNHVVEDADKLSVQFIDGKSVEALVKGTQEDVDLAVIAIPLEDIDSDTKSAIHVAVMGDSDSLRVGEPAIAIGNALGYGQSVTAGVISAVKREVTVDNVTNELIQTDAAINPGNSGGALLNMNGEVIGINAMKYSMSGVEGMGYAIPISTAQPIIDELMNRETKQKVDEEDTAYLGIAGIDVTPDVAEAYDMTEGIYVAQVTEGTAADQAGIEKGDIITKFDGQKVSSMEELKQAMEFYSAGTEVELEVQKRVQDGYEEQNITVTLGKKNS